MLTDAEEAMIVTFMHHTLWPPDDGLHALQPSIPHLARSAGHRSLQRHDISGLPDVEADKPKSQRLEPYPIGFFHVDIVQSQTADSQLYLLIGIDQTAKFAVTQRVKPPDRRTAWQFLKLCLRPHAIRCHSARETAPLIGAHVWMPPLMQGIF
ncbi:MAG: hypothetical protein ACOH2H_24480 [Cypionkella sp.]